MRSQSRTLSGWLKFHGSGCGEPSYDSRHVPRCFRWRGGWEVERVSENESWLAMDSRHVTDQCYIWNPDFLTCHIHKYISLILRFFIPSSDSSARVSEASVSRRWAVGLEKKKNPKPYVCASSGAVFIFNPSECTTSCPCHMDMLWNGRMRESASCFFSVFFFKRAASVISPCCPVKYPHPHFITHFPCWQMKSRQCCQLILHSFFFFF